MTYYRYTPKRPIKSFQDLEVYQKLLASGVTIAKHLAANANDPIAGKLKSIVLDLPVQVATAHSVRFSNPAEAAKVLDAAMLNCNLAVVFLELYRDLGPKEDKEDGSTDFFDEQIRVYLAVRWKLMHLLRSWEKFRSQNSQNSAAKFGG